MRRLPSLTARGRLTLVAVGLAAAIAVGGLAVHAGDRTPKVVAAPSPAPGLGAPAAPSDNQSAAAPLRLAADGTVPPTSDPLAFTTLVSQALFTWDTTSTDPGEVRGRLLDVADPTGEESPGLLADLDGYVPDAATWTRLGTYSTRQWIDVTTAAVPAAWTAALAQTRPYVAPGTTAVTVTGVRRRAGTWEREAVTSQHDVAFTAFVVCAPTYPTCRLLRLSALDNPLR
ncbi:MAG: hypothetical protein FWF90_09335 [Promicromonosporaceae bacterium]|nr:hypothetical protein [Promicromonosporaceae bacterium]